MKLLFAVLLLFCNNSQAFSQYDKDDIDRVCLRLSEIGELSVKARNADISLEAITKVVTDGVTEKNSINLVTEIVKIAYEQKKVTVKEYAKRVNSACHQVFNDNKQEIRYYMY